MKYLFMALTLLSVNLQADYYQSSFTMTPLNGNEKTCYLAEVQIEKMNDDCSFSQLIASPKLICMAGKPTEMTIESENGEEFLTVSISISDDIEEQNIHTHVLVKENNKVVLSNKNKMFLNR